MNAVLSTILYPHSTLYTTTHRFLHFSLGWSPVQRIRRRNLLPFLYIQSCSPGHVCGASACSPFFNHDRFLTRSFILPPTSLSLLRQPLSSACCHCITFVQLCVDYGAARHPCTHSVAYARPVDSRVLLLPPHPALPPRAAAPLLSHSVLLPHPAGVPLSRPLQLPPSRRLLISTTTQLRCTNLRHEHVTRPQLARPLPSLQSAQSARKQTVDRH